MRRWIGLATLTVVTFVALHALGAREDAAFLSGSRAGSLGLGVAYVLSYFGTVVAMPIVMIAAALLYVGDWAKKRGEGAGSTHPPPRLTSIPTTPEAPAEEPGARKVFEERMKRFF